MFSINKNLKFLKREVQESLRKKTVCTPLKLASTLIVVKWRQRQEVHNFKDKSKYWNKYLDFLYLEFSSYKQILNSWRAGKKPFKSYAPLYTADMLQ